MTCPQCHSAHVHRRETDHTVRTRCLDCHQQTTERFAWARKPGMTVETISQPGESK